MLICENRYSKGLLLLQAPLLLDNTYNLRIMTVYYISSLRTHEFVQVLGDYLVRGSSPIQELESWLNWFTWRFICNLSSMVSCSDNRLLDNSGYPGLSPLFVISPAWSVLEITDLSITRGTRDYHLRL